MKAAPTIPITVIQDLVALNTLWREVLWIMFNLSVYLMLLAGLRLSMWLHKEARNMSKGDFSYQVQTLAAYLALLRPNTLTHSSIIPTWWALLLMYSCSLRLCLHYMDYTTTGIHSLSCGPL